MSLYMATSTLYNNKKTAQIETTINVELIIVGREKWRQHQNTEMTYFWILFSQLAASWHASGLCVCFAVLVTLSAEEQLKQLQEERTCKVCMDKMVSMVFIPCGHLAVCSECAAILRHCPICRAVIRGSMRAFLSWRPLHTCTIGRQLRKRFKVVKRI